MVLSEQFAKHLAQVHVPDLAGRSQRFSSGEVAEMSPDEHKALLSHAASIQRGRPESVMGDIQRFTRGGLYSHSAEHIGDLTHRLNESGGRFGTEFVAPKVRTQLNSLTQGYGYEREHLEQMRSGGVDLEGLHKLGETYAHAHRAVPIYNRPSMLGNMAAVSLGKMRFGDTTMFMRRLQQEITSPEQFRHRMSQQGTVDFLRDEEERGL